MKNNGTPKKPRNLGITIGSIIILVLSVVTFIFVPAMADRASGDDPLVFGTYNGKKIEYKSGTLFADAVANAAQQAQNEGKELSGTTYYSVFNDAFNSTVLAMAFEEAVNSSGYIVPDTVIERNMLPYFQDSNGQYSAKIFRDTPDSTKLKIRENVANSLVYNRFQTDILGDQASYISTNNMYGSKVSSKEAPFIEDMGKKQRSFEAAVFKTSEYPVSEAEKFARTNKDLFTTYDLSAVVVKEESQAKKIASQLSKNELTFEDAISTYSTKVYTSAEGKVNNKLAYSLKNILTSDADFAAVTSLSAGAVSGVVPVANSSYAIFRCDSAPVAADLTNDATLQTVRTYMVTYEAGVIEDYFTAVAKDFAAAAVTEGFACAERFGGSTLELPAFPVNYAENPLMGAAGSEDISGLNTNVSFLTTAFSLADNEISSPVVLGSNIVVLRMLEESEPEYSSISFLYPYYASQYDAMSMQTSFLSSDKVNNDVLSVWFANFYGM
ncbi:MAG: peptidyl-prolyl cis-trans isomerase [Treponemataceae bacterium]|nr:peptidyl-prolyl cis-trans isomerase [Treponemataceae bacterium]